MASAYYPILLLGEGYADGAKYDGETEEVHTYIPNPTGVYGYDSSTGEFNYEDDGGFDRVTKTVRTSGSGDMFHAYFDSINLYYSKEEIESNNISLFVKVATSLAKMKVRYAPDSNYVFLEQKGTMDCGFPQETGSFNNSNVRYMGSRQVSIRKIDTPIRDGESIKFRVEASMDSVDDFVVTSLVFKDSDGKFAGGFDA